MKTETFRCERLKCCITREACARRHKGYKHRGSTRRASRMDIVMQVSDACGGCPIGAQHAAGELPDVPAHELFAQRSGLVPIRRCVVCAEPLPTRRRNVRTCSLACASDWGQGRLSIDIDDAWIQETVA